MRDEIELIHKIASNSKNYSGNFINKDLIERFIANLEPVFEKNSSYQSRLKFYNHFIRKLVDAKRLNYTISTTKNDARYWTRIKQKNKEPNRDQIRTLINSISNLQRKIILIDAEFPQSVPPEFPPYCTGLISSKVYQGDFLQSVPLS